jgi:hypothetical protein
MKYLILICFYVAAMQMNAIAQQTFLERFTAAEVNSRIYLEWLIKAGSTCQGIRIFRSTDSINFIQIGDIDGVCGNINTPQAYNFTDDNPVKNAINYYRLELGGIGYSKIVSVEIIDLQNGGYQIRPNPVNEHARIYFSNPSNQALQLKVFTITGDEVFHSTVYQNYAHIGAGHFQYGLYFFTISVPGNTPLVKGKFMVMR